MDAFALSLLRPTRRASRGIAALVVLALVGWLGVAATHLHLPGELAAQAHSHGHDHGSVHEHGDDGHPAGERAHPCSLCLSLDRGAGPSAPPAIVVAIVAATFDPRAPDDPVVSLAAPAAYRSRAPPAA
jgi:hypothetical protein